LEVDQVENLEAAVAAIRTCKTLDSLDSMLTRFEFMDSKEIIDCLNKCMYNPERYFSTGGVTIEEDLELTKQIFLTGTWRLNKYYDRMGIPLENKVESAHA
jgi:hypothetical protein